MREGNGISAAGQKEKKNIGNPEFSFKVVRCEISLSWTLENERNKRVGE